MNLVKGQRVFTRDGHPAVVVEASRGQVLVEHDGGRAEVLPAGKVIPAESEESARKREGGKA